ncbi:cytochrome c biogenesis protein CcdA, partial [Micromonospora purpureochromogenes]
MGETFRQVAESGPLLLAIGAAALAGLVSFLSPCVLPLMPGYLSYVTGLAGADLEGRARAEKPPAGGATLGDAGAAG